MDPITVAAVGLVVAVGTLALLWKPRDAERSELLERIALNAAALVVAAVPGAPWATLFELVVKQILSAGITKNREAVERAAAMGLTRLGKNPGASVTK